MTLSPQQQRRIVHWIRVGGQCRSKRRRLVRKADRAFAKMALAAWDCAQMRRQMLGGMP